MFQKNDKQIRLVFEAIPWQFFNEDIKNLLSLKHHLLRWFICWVGVKVLERY